MDCLPVFNGSWIQDWFFRIGKHKVLSELSFAVLSEFQFRTWTFKFFQRIGSIRKGSGSFIRTDRMNGFSGSGRFLAGFLGSDGFQKDKKK